MKAIIYHLLCPGCFMLLHVCKCSILTNTYILACMNPGCENFKKQFDAPTVELNPVTETNLV
jgi:hypothetical protein